MPLKQRERSSRHLELEGGEYGSLAFLLASERPLTLDIQSLANRTIRLDFSNSRRVLAYVGVPSYLLE